MGFSSQKVIYGSLIGVIAVLLILNFFIYYGESSLIGQHVGVFGDSNEDNCDDVHDDCCDPDPDPSGCYGNIYRSYIQMGGTCNWIISHQYCSWPCAEQNQPENYCSGDTAVRYLSFNWDVCDFEESQQYCDPCYSAGCEDGFCKPKTLNLVNLPFLQTCSGNSIGNFGSTNCFCISIETAEIVNSQAYDSVCPEDAMNAFQCPP